MKVGSSARWEAQEGLCAGSAGVTLEPALCRRLAGTALQNSQNTDHIHVSCSGSASRFTLFSAPTTPFSGRKAGQEEGQGAGDDPETTATVQKPDHCLCTCCLPAQQHHTAGAGPAHEPNSSLGFSISPGLKLIWVQNLNPGPDLTHPITEGRKGSEGQKEQWVRGQGDGLGASPPRCLLTLWWVHSHLPQEGVRVIT